MFYDFFKRKQSVVPVKCFRSRGTLSRNFARLLHNCVDVCGTCSCGIRSIPMFRFKNITEFTELLKGFCPGRGLFSTLVPGTRETTRIESKCPSVLDENESVSEPICFMGPSSEACEETRETVENRFGARSEFVLKCVSRPRPVTKNESRFRDKTKRHAYETGVIVSAGRARVNPFTTFVYEPYCVDRERWARGKSTRFQSRFDASAAPAVRRRSNAAAFESRRALHFHGRLGGQALAEDASPALKGRRVVTVAPASPWSLLKLVIRFRRVRARVFTRSAAGQRVVFQNRLSSER